MKYTLTSHQTLYSTRFTTFYHMWAKSESRQTTAVAVARKKIDFVLKVIKLKDEGKASRTVAEIMGVGKTQVNNILTRKEEVMEFVEFWFHQFP